MIGIGEKSYPPIINSSLPAFYWNEQEQSYLITIPFSMNKVVNFSEITGFSLKIKTVQTNTEVCVLKENGNNIETYINQGQVQFKTSSDEIKAGQFYKVQMAYIDSGNNIGYYSSVGIIKCVSKPDVYIKGFKDGLDKVNFFQQKTIGIYKFTDEAEDITEKPYSYNFSLYDENNQLLESSGWLYHINENYNEKNKEYFDEYNFKTVLEEEKNYYIQYDVLTINNLSISSFLYNCIEYSLGDSHLGILINGINNFDDGYIKLFLELQDGYLFSKLRELINNYKNKYGYYYENEYDEGEGYLIYQYENIFYPNISFDFFEKEKRCEIEYKNANGEVEKEETIYLFNQSEKIDKKIEILRVDAITKEQQIIKIVHFSSYGEMLNWSFKDFTVEQGKEYQYCLREYDKDQNLYYDKIYSNKILADFEDMFLWDGQRQLKIRFNPNVSSFKTNILETKVDTIGSKYPFFFRNGKVEYKEFPISGLISYWMDDNELFINYEDNLGLAAADSKSRRSETPSPQTENFNNIPTTNLLNYNIKSERDFKLEVLKWLENGKIKLFKSPAEGNYLVKLLNISLSPENKLNRMLHTFSCTAYEAEEFNYQNLVKLDFISSDNENNNLALDYLGVETIKLKDKINNYFSEEDYSSLIIQLNNYSPIKTINIKNSSNNLKLFIENKETNSLKEYVLLTPFEELKLNNLDSNNSLYLDIFTFYQNRFRLNREFFEQFQLDNNFRMSVKNELLDLVGDAEITYYYIKNSNEESNIEEVYIENICSIETWDSTTSKNLSFIDEDNNETHEIIKLYINDIYENLEEFSEGTTLDYSIKLITLDNQTIIFSLDTIPSVNIFQYPYKNIILGNKVIANIIKYQDKIIKYKSGE